MSYGITVCNEADELERLLSFLVQQKDRQDEILILQDSTKADKRVADVIDKYRGTLIVKQQKLNNDFATFKNNLIDMASGDYLFQIDADELPAEKLIQNIKRELIKHTKSDCFAVPRVNLVEGLTKEFIDKWNWDVDAKGRINFPDYQLRIFKLNNSIAWKNKVHEELTGFQHCQYLPSANEDFCLIHSKDIDRQKRQNDFYDTL
ncbi:glycosyltransferase [Spirosoma endophyticum]|uniref:glycosyltransferase n=1 Tax=Spirosoma endophyticum TaxID=662367 RepID=UPI0015A53BD8|nr:glycosyltransferase [Spirosoma endophyticum]